MSITQRQALFLVLALVSITLLAYWPGMSGRLLFDDFPNIIQQKAVHATELSLESLQRAGRAFGGLVGRPLAMASFAVDHVFWGLNPRGYKLTSLAVHVVNTLLVLLLVRRLLMLAGVSARALAVGSFLVALIWAIHPLQVSTVLYVVQRMETMSVMFMMLALLAYLRGRLNQRDGLRAWPWLVACVPLVGLGLLCKETAILFPAFTLALELTLLGFQAQQARAARLWRLSYAAATIAGALLFFLVVLPLYMPAEVYAIRDFTLAERLLTQLRVLPMYLGWILLPRPDSFLFYYDHYVVSKSLLDPVSTLFGGVLLAALLAAAFGLRRKMPLFSLGIFWFFASHFLTSNIVPLELVFEHRNYFAILGVLLAVADLVRRVPAGDDRRIRPLMATVLVLGLFVLTLTQSATWGHPLNLALALVQKNPDSPRASTDLGEQYMILARNDPDSEYYALAIREFERGSRVPNASPMPEQGLIVMSALAGQPAKPEWWDRIITKLETRAIGPQELTMTTGFLQMRDKGIEIDDARIADAYLVLVNRMNMPPTQYYAYGIHAHKHLKDEVLAQKLFRRAVDDAKSDPGFVAALVQALYRSGYVDQARLMADYARESAGVDVPPPHDMQPPLPADSEANP